MFVFGICLAKFKGVKRDGSIVKSKIKELHIFEGVGRRKVDEVVAGDICAVVGLEGFEIGDTPQYHKSLPMLKELCYQRYSCKF